MVVIHDGGPTELGFRSPGGPDAARDPRSARRRRPPRSRAGCAVPDVATGRVAPPEGPRERRPDLAHAAGDSPPQPPRARAAARRNQLARPLPGAMGRAVRPPRRRPRFAATAVMT